MIHSDLLDSEYRDTVPSFVNVFPQGGLHFGRKIDKLESLDGFKVIVRVIADLAPIAVIALLPAVYLALGCVMDPFGIIMLPAPSFLISTTASSGGGW